MPEDLSGTATGVPFSLAANPLKVGDRVRAVPGSSWWRHGACRITKLLPSGQGGCENLPAMEVAWDKPFASNPKKSRTLVRTSVVPVSLFIPATEAGERTDSALAGAVTREGEDVAQILHARAIEACCLRALRSLRKVALSKVARVMGLSAAMLAAWCKRKTVPFLRLQQLADALGITVHEIDARAAEYACETEDLRAAQRVEAAKTIAAAPTVPNPRHLFLVPRPSVAVAVAKEPQAPASKEPPILNEFALVRELCEAGMSGYDPEKRRVLLAQAQALEEKSSPPKAPVAPPMLQPTALVLALCEAAQEGYDPEKRRVLRNQARALLGEPPLPEEQPVSKWEAAPPRKERITSKPRSKKANTKRAKATTSKARKAVKSARPSSVPASPPEPEQAPASNVAPIFNEDAMRRREIAVECARISASLRAGAEELRESLRELRNWRNA